MSNETDVVSHSSDGNDLDIQLVEATDVVLPKQNTVDVTEPIKINSNEVNDVGNGAITVKEEKELQELVNMDASCSNTMAMLAATYSPSDSVTDETINEDVTYVTLDDDDDDTAPVSPLSSKANTQFKDQKLKVSGLPSKKYKLRPKKRDIKKPISKKKLRQNMKMLNQKKLEKRERLKLEAGNRIEIRLDDLIEPVVTEPELSPPNESSPMRRSMDHPISDTEDSGYVKAGYPFRAGKRPPNYDAETLQEWTAMQEEKRLMREQQKIIDFKEEMKKIGMRRLQNNKVKKMKPKTAEINELDFLNAISDSIDNNNSDDVKILKVVTKPKKKRMTSSPVIYLTPKPLISLAAAKKRNKLRVIQPVPPKPKPSPVLCLPSSSFRKAPLHTLPVFTPRKSVIRFPPSIIPQPQKSPFTDDCFTFVPCPSPSTSSASNNITVPPPINTTTSKRVQLKKQAAKLNSSADEEETIFDECFSAVPCSPVSTSLPSPFCNQSTVTTSYPSHSSPVMKPSIATSEVSNQIIDDCFTSVPCASSIYTNEINIVPQNSALTVPISSQSTLVPQFSTLSSNASILAPLQLTQQVQTITIPAHMLPPPGTPLQIVFILPNAPAHVSSNNNNNNNNSTSPIILHPQPSTSSSPSSNDAKVIQVKCEMKE